VIHIAIKGWQVFYIKLRSISPKNYRFSLLFPSPFSVKKDNILDLF